MRQSAGMRSPSSISTTSPTTSSSASMTDNAPPRTTLARQTDICLSFSIAASARYCCKKPTKAFKRMIKSKIAVSASSLLSPVTKASTPDKKAANTRMIVIKSLNCAKNKPILLFFLPAFKAFLPFVCKRRAASSCVSPRKELPTSFKTSSTCFSYCSIRIKYEKKAGNIPPPLFGMNGHTPPLRSVRQRIVAPFRNDAILYKSPTHFKAYSTRLRRTSVACANCRLSYSVPLKSSPQYRICPNFALQ